MDAAIPQLPVIPSQRARVPSPAPATGVRTLVDDFLAEQASTTAVERFAGAHDDLEAGAEPRQAQWYRDLLPATPPGPGQQYAFEVDLDACSGCKACVTACHNLNGLDGDASWRSVGMLTGTGERPVVQPVTTGCHHCAEPGCLDGCPVDAYVKLDSGVVEHLDDQCIGCTYCTLTCPYEVPQYDAERGIVRKCDLCHDRLAEGEAPACVQACPTEAIQITLVDVDDAGREPWGFDAPAPAATRPTSVFRSSRDLRTDVASADVHTVQPRHAHPPLVVMLVLTQLAVGTFVGLEVLRALGGLALGEAAIGAAVALAVTGIALVASLAHLGRPQYAWRAVIGLRHSWLSREIVAFGAFAPLGALHAWTLASDPSWLSAGFTGGVASLAGLGAIATSVMVYVATRREGWRVPYVAVRFGLTTLALGAVGTVAAGAGLATGAVTAARWCRARCPGGRGRARRRPAHPRPPARAGHDRCPRRCGPARTAGRTRPAARRRRRAGAAAARRRRPAAGPWSADRCHGRDGWGCPGQHTRR